MFESLTRAIRKKKYLSHVGREPRTDTRWDPMIGGEHVGQLGTHVGGSNHMPTNSLILESSC
jgi:hypothetical protein